MRTSASSLAWCISHPACSISLKVVVLFLGCVGVFYWLIRVLSSKEYVCCVCDPSVCLGVPSICLICVCMRDVISE